MNLVECVKIRAGDETKITDGARACISISMRVERLTSEQRQSNREQRVRRKGGEKKDVSGAGKIVTAAEKSFKR